MGLRPMNWLFHALSSEQRRRLIEELEDGEWVSIDTFADDERMKVQLVHSHLPKLRDVGIIELDGDDIIEPGPRHDEALEVLNAAKQAAQKSPTAEA